MSIIGIDISKHGLATCVKLSCLPNNLQEFYHSKSFETLSLTPSQKGIEKLLSLSPDALVMEPTGGWYSAFWHRVARVYGIEVFWVGHADLYSQRKNFGFKNKYDDIDALCLAACYFNPSFVNRLGQKRFLTYHKLSTLEPVRELFYELEQLDKLHGIFVSHQHQRLSFEFPEAAGCSFQRSDRDGLSKFWQWLGGENVRSRKGMEYSDSIAPQLGIDFSDYTIDHAKAITELEKRMTKHEHQLNMALDNPVFAPYLEVLSRYGFGTTLQAALLLHCFPVERFLVDGRPLIDYYQGKNGKTCKKHTSLRQFQSYLGLSRQVHQSGDKESKIFAGSTLMRSHLFMWAKGKITIGLKPETKSRRSYFEHSGEYQDSYLYLTRNGVKYKDAIFRILYRVSRHLFHDLVKLYQE